MDKDLMQLLRDDRAGSGAAPRSNARWTEVERLMEAEVLGADIASFRSKPSALLAMVGVADTMHVKSFRPPSLKHRAAEWVRAAIGRAVASGRAPVLPYMMSLADLREALAQRARLEGLTLKARDLKEVPTSEVGAPGDLFRHEGAALTVNHLSFYRRYAFAQAHLDLPEGAVVAEVGSGSGSQAEVWMKARPDLTYLCFDVPAPVCLGETYLDKVFPGRVVSYRQTRSWTGLGGLERGKIHMFGAWQLKLLESAPIDLFWSAGTLSALDAEAATALMASVSRTATQVYFCEMEAAEHRAQHAGVATPSLVAALGPSFTAVAERDAARGAGRFAGYRETVLRRLAH
jgi:putative sugar O-methyltransferase